MKGLLKGLLIVVILLTGCQSDLYTKRVVTEQLKNHRHITLIQGYLNLRYTENNNGAVGLFHQLRPASRQPLLVGLKLATLLGVCVFVLMNRRWPLVRLLPFAVIISGALGNLIDRIRFGYVVDFIHFHVRDFFHWPIFNVADILIFTGVALLFLQLLLGMARGAEAGDAVQ